MASSSIRCRVFVKSLIWSSYAPSAQFPCRSFVFSASSLIPTGNKSHSSCLSFFSSHLSAFSSSPSRCLSTQVSSAFRSSTPFTSTSSSPSSSSSSSSAASSSVSSSSASSANCQHVAPAIRGLATMVGAPLRKKMTVVDVQKKRDSGIPLTMVTAYTYPSAMHVDAAGMDLLLCGDSLAMVELGYDTTLPVTVDEMLYHCKAVARGATYSLLVGDMPFGSYEASPEQAYLTAVRFLKEGLMDCVKVEGGKMRAPTIRALVDGGVAVMGHIGLTPQRISILGGFRAQGRTLAAAKQLVEDAIALEEAGCFAMVVECVPPLVASAITAAVRIPTIGIGAGPHCSGQVLVYHDLLGMLEHAHHAAVVPRFCKQYAKLGDAIQKGLEEYKKEVENRQFPGDEFSPYKISEKDEKLMKEELEQFLTKKKKEKKEKEEGASQRTSGQSEETIKLY